MFSLEVWPDDGPSSMFYTILNILEIFDLLYSSIACEQFLL